MFEAPQAHGSRRSNFVREQFRGRLRACLQLEECTAFHIFRAFQKGATILSRTLLASLIGGNCEVDCDSGEGLDSLRSLIMGFKVPLAHGLAGRSGQDWWTTEHL